MSATAKIVDFDNCIQRLRWSTGGIVGGGDLFAILAALAAELQRQGVEVVPLQSLFESILSHASEADRVRFRGALRIAEPIAADVLRMATQQRTKE